MTCRDREKNNFPFTDNTNEDCEGNYYSTQCIIVNGNEEYENQELNKFISATLNKMEEMQNLINILLNNPGWDKVLEAPNGVKYKLSVDENSNLITTEIEE